MFITLRMTVVAKAVEAKGVEGRPGCSLSNVEIRGSGHLSLL